MQEQDFAGLTALEEPRTLSQVVKCEESGERLTRTLSALADPTRRDILHRLSRGPASISALAAPYGLTLPGVLKHVRILERVELVATVKTGRTRQCELGPARLDDVSQWVTDFHQRWDRRLDRIESYLADRKGAAT
jgi:DNA-binding transcriptional ArsR family regulator